MLRRGIREAERAAIDASIDDPAWAPDAIRALARARYQPIAGIHRGDGLGHARLLFGDHAIDGLIAVSSPDPGKVRVRLPASADFEVAAVRRGEGQAVVRVAVRGYAWLGPFGFAVTQAMEGVATALGGSANRARTRRLVTYWIFDVPQGTFERAEPEESGIHNLLLVDPSGKMRAGEALRDQAVREIVDIRDDPLVPIDVADGLTEEPAAAAIELAGFDGRWEHEVIAASVRTLVARWARALEGNRAPLEEIASPAAVSALLEARDQVLRSPRVERIDVRRVHAYRTPPEITIVVWPHALTWRLAAASADEPWRLVDADAERSL